MNGAHEDEELAFLLDPADNVAVARRNLPSGALVRAAGRTVRLREPIRFGHKIALEPIESGGPIRKYGQVIGFAATTIEPGRHVHVHNIDGRAFDRECAAPSPFPPAPRREAPRFFEGYLRADGRVGTRNYVAVVSTVNCSASTARRIASHFTPESLARRSGVDGVFAVTHKTGCGMAEAGADRIHLQRCLAGFAGHPNVYGCVVVGLGCEVNQAQELIETHRLTGPTGAPPRVLTVQAGGGVARTVAAGIRAVEELLPRAAEAVRTKQPASKLVLGTNCGGSDAYSGATANPVVGRVSDRVVAQGGVSILAETPEIYGAEHLLTRRAASQEAADKLLDRIRWWEWYTSIFNARIDNNPSHGNKEGGLSTIYEKSLGAVAKGGTTPLVDVVGYAERATRPGLVFMDTPGFDPVSVTGIVAGGANVVLFTTGRGSVLGLKPTPTVKIASNSLLYERMSDEMDFDAGVVLNGASIEEVGDRLFDLVLEVASGRRTQSERLDLGDDEFAPWTIGPVL
jgi:altronate hydrolase